MAQKIARNFTKCAPRMWTILSITIAKTLRSCIHVKSRIGKCCIKLQGHLEAVCVTQAIDQRFLFASGLQLDLGNGGGADGLLSLQTLDEEDDNTANEGGDTEVLPLAEHSSPFMETRTSEPGLLPDHELAQLRTACRTDSPDERALPRRRSSLAAMPCRRSSLGGKMIPPPDSGAQPEAVQGSSEHQETSPRARRISLGSLRPPSSQKAHTQSKSPAVLAKVENMQDLPKSHDAEPVVAAIQPKKPLSEQTRDRDEAVLKGPRASSELGEEGGQETEDAEQPTQSTDQMGEPAMEDTGKPDPAILRSQLAKAKRNASIYYTKVLLLQSLGSSGHCLTARHCLNLSQPILCKKLRLASNNNITCRVERDLADLMPHMLKFKLPLAVCFSPCAKWRM